MAKLSRRDAAPAVSGRCDSSELQLAPPVAALTLALVSFYYFGKGEVPLRSFGREAIYTVKMPERNRVARFDGA